MPARAKKASAPSHEDLVRLSGVLMGTFGLRSPSSLGAVVIERKQPEHLEYFAKTFGGEVKTFEDRNSKTWFGWFVTKEEKLAMVKMMDEAGVLDPMDSILLTTIVDKLGGYKQT
jgi:hypothetical protein